MQRYGEILKRNWPIAGIAIFLLVFMAWRNASLPAKYPLPEKEVQVEGSAPQDAAKDAVAPLDKRLPSTEAQKPADVVIYVTGAIKQPGVQTVASGTRLYEAIDKAGGFSLEADQDRINLAAKVEDGMHYVIPQKGQEILPDIQPLRLAQGAGMSGASAGGKVNINQADKTALMELDGIGETLAKRIIEYREKNGPFASPEELLQVSGIGDKKYEAIRDQIAAP